MLETLVRVKQNKMASKVLGNKKVVYNFFGKKRV